MLKEQIRELADRLHAQVIADRRHLHENPELSFLEFKTSAFVKARLDEIGVPWEVVAETGIIGYIKGEKSSGKTIALRADMDALPIRETNPVSYASRNEGVMHACGHDAHTASLLATAAILNTVKSQFGGTIILIFQPGEEKLPGGASLIIKSRVLEKLNPSVIIAQHVSPMIPLGKIGIRKGKFMASMDEIKAVVRGKGGHGAQPHLNIDPVVIAAHIITGLQQIVSRVADPAMPTVLSFGKVIANGGINIIPDEVYLEGTFRTLNETWRDKAHELVKKMAVTIAESMGGGCSFEITRGYPFLINEEKLTAAIQANVGEYIGEDNITEPDIWMAAEDFAMYSNVADSCYYLLGVRNEKKGIISSLHTPGFDIDEEALNLAPGLMAHIAVKQLGY